MEDIVKTKIGIWEIQYLCDYKDKYSHQMYHVKCMQCGFEKDLRKVDIPMATKCVHQNANWIYRNMRLEGIFNGMRRRCYDKECKDYKWYGLKGVRVCDEWLNNPIEFEKWSMVNGYADDLTIDRIDADKNYCPENCRWISKKANAKYKSTTNYIKVDGEMHTGKDWAKILGFSPNIINTYVRKYGIDNVIEFINRFKSNPALKPKNKQSYYSLYMES